MNLRMASNSQKLALVTGAGHSKGIGYAIAKRLLEQGILVLGLDIKSADHQLFECRHCDITDVEMVNETVSGIAEEFGSISFLVNNAGVGLGDPAFLDCTNADWLKTFDINVFGAVNVCRALLPHLSAEGGSIVNVASLAGLGAMVGIPAPYTASKFAIVGLTKSLALELAPKGIRVNAICPGSIKTQLHETSLEMISRAEGVDRATAETLEVAAIPMGYSATSDEVAGLAAFLCSDESKYMTGTAIPIAGGMASGL